MTSSKRGYGLIRLKIQSGFQDISNEAFKENIKILKEENSALRNELNVLKLANEREKETTVLLEDKVAKAESLFSNFHMFGSALLSSAFQLLPLNL